MENFNRSEITKNAWKLIKQKTVSSFSTAMKAAWVKAKNNCMVWVCGGTYPISVYNFGQEVFIKYLLKNNFSLFGSIIQDLFNTGESRPEELIEMYNNSIDLLD